MISSRQEFTMVVIFFVNYVPIILLFIFHILVNCISMLSSSDPSCSVFVEDVGVPSSISILGGEGRWVLVF